MTTVVWDVIVVGAGPAGCAAAARALQREPQARVLMLDRAAFPRDKTCGDGIAGAAITHLARLGLSASALTDGYRPVNGFRVRSPGGVQVARVMPEPVWVIPRAIFDARLLAGVLDRGAQLLRHTARQIDVDDDGVVIDGVLHARVVIGADGAESAIRRGLQHPPNPPGSMAVAIRGYGPELPGQNGAQPITMTAQHWPAYAWSFPIGHGRANLGYGQLLTDDPASRTQLLHGLRALLPDADPDPDSLRAHRLPLSTTRPPVRDGRVLLAGDAHSLINPLTGEGIYYAVISGALAGEAALAGHDAGQAYRSALRRRLGRYLRHSATLARVTRWPLLMDTVLRGAANDQATFNDPVRLGLQDGTVTARLLRAATTPTTGNTAPPAHHRAAQADPICTNLRSSHRAARRRKPPRAGSGHPGRTRGVLTHSIQQNRTRPHPRRPRMPGKYVIKKGTSGKFHFNLLASNGQVIATSETYESKESALNGIESVRTNASSTTVDDQS